MGRILPGVGMGGWGEEMGEGISGGVKCIHAGDFSLFVLINTVILDQCVVHEL